VRWLWASHVAHHSSRLMNFSTAFRQSLTYPISGMWLFWLPLVLLGFEVQLVLAVVAINLAFQFFVHTQSGKHWGILGWVLNTPAWHRVHHACNPQYIDRNYAGVLVIWDRLFGTFVPEEEVCRYGITDDFQSNNPITITFYEWRKILKLWPQLKGWRNKHKLLFGPPEAFSELCVSNNKKQGKEQEGSE
jgi:sterol desaturase/sphingolipid hydroxylase (fatty acid hydroxylase superfamily)